MNTTNTLERLEKGLRARERFVDIRLRQIKLRTTDLFSKHSDLFLHDDFSSGFDRVTPRACMERAASPAASVSRKKREEAKPESGLVVSRKTENYSNPYSVADIELKKKICIVTPESGESFRIKLPESVIIELKWLVSEAVSLVNEQDFMSKLDYPIRALSGGIKGLNDATSCFDAALEQAAKGMQTNLSKEASHVLGTFASTSLLIKAAIKEALDV